MLWKGEKWSFFYEIQTKGRSESRIFVSSVCIRERNIISLLRDYEDYFFFTTQEAAQGHRKTHNNKALMTVLHSQKSENNQIKHLTYRMR